jgi:hypothetical protein
MAALKLNDANTKQLANSSYGLLPKIGIFSPVGASITNDYPVTGLQSSLIKGFVGQVIPKLKD